MTLRRKSNALNKLFEQNNEIRDLIKSKGKVEQQGMFVVLEGQCSVYSDGGQKILDLPIGSTVGENLLARVKKTYSNFGIIVTGQRKTQLAFIPKGLFFRIPNYDVYQIYLSSQNRKTFDEVQLDM